MKKVIIFDSKNSDSQPRAAQGGSKDHNPKVVIFDFDGTIADSLDAIVHIMNRHSTKYGYKKITNERRDQLRHETSQKILSDFNLSPWKLLFLALRVKAELRKELLHIKPIWGIKKALEDLKKQGFTLGIATSNSKPNVNLFLEKNDLDYFDFVYARTVFSKSRMIKSIMRDFKLNPKNVHYVGDETRDIDAARKAGVGIVSVAWGMHSMELLQANKPDAVVTQPIDLVKILS